MSHGSVDGPVARVGRAAEHYRFLKDELHGGVDRRLRPVTAERHKDGLEYRFFLGEIEALDSAWSLVLGEALYNLRSALDHLAYELHRRRWRGRIPDKVGRNSQFPVLEKRRQHKSGRVLRTDEWYDIGTLGSRERSLIESLQPYHTRQHGDRSRSWIGQRRDVLRDVATLNNWDKHRGLHLAHSAAQGVFRPQFPRRFGFKQHPAFGVPLESNTCVDTWTFTTPPPTEQIDLHPGIFSTVVIDPSGDRIEVLSNLGGNILGVASIIARFGARFPPPKHVVDLSFVRLTVDPPPHVLPSVVQ